MKFQIKDTLTSEVVAQRGTKASADKWCSTLNEGLKGRYIVVKVV
jgi:hypothetical protein